MATHDVAIIGGGPAGLTAAATLMRQLHTVILFDSGKYRNDKAYDMHMVPGLEGKDPAQFRTESRAALLSKYSTLGFHDVPVAKVEKKGDSHFSITDSDGKEWNVRKIILAIGSAEIFPAIQGYGDLWGTRIFQCLFCKGYEDRGASSAGILAIPPVPGLPVDMLVGLAIHGAMNASQFSESVTFYTHGDEALAAALKASTSSKEKWTVDSRRIGGLFKVEGSSQGVTVEFEDGTKREDRFLVSQPLTVPGGQFVQQLGLATTQMGDIQAEAPFHQTSVRGVFAAGDCITPYKVIPGAISSGCNAAVGVSTQLQAETYGFPPPL